MADIFNKAAPYAIVRDWLGKEPVERLLRFVQSNEHLFTNSGVYYKDGTKGICNEARISKKIDPGPFNGELKDNVVDLLPFMFEKLGIKRFTPSKIEMELVAHGNGAFFARHIDTLRLLEGRLRVISAVYYFHALPKAFSGGVLRLYSLDKDSYVDIPPDYDTIVFFPSFFPHEVLPVNCPRQHFLDSRFAVNFWINRN